MDRHNKWKRAKAGDRVGAGQQYRVESEGSDEVIARDFKGSDEVWFVDGYYDGKTAELFVDSTYKERLQLPTYWTWGMAFYKADLGSVTNWKIGEWALTVGGSFKHRESGQMWHPSTIVDFVPLTEAQVKQMKEAGSK